MRSQKVRNGLIITSIRAVSSAIWRLRWSMVSSQERVVVAESAG